jgi:ferredoxin
MDIAGKTVLVCDCEGTMPLDGRALAKACRAAPETLATQLCGSELGRFVAALGAGKPVIVACTQEAPRFDEQREDARATVPVSYVNIRERAGWAEEAKAATPKIAALLAEAALDLSPVPMVGMKSEGVALVYGTDESALAAARRLSDALNVTVMLKPGAAVTPPGVAAVPVVQGTVRAAKGHLGAFELMVDDYATPAPSSRRTLAFGPARNGATSRCDLILDLSGGAPLFPLAAPRDGYVRADPARAETVEAAIATAATLVGDFEKPRYVNYRADICAHSRSRKIGCTRCLDVCPAGAIAPAGDTVAFDAMACAGCGGCAAVCPTGAAAYTMPPAGDLLARLAALLDTYHAAGGAGAVLLVHDARHGDALIEALARFGAGLPARVLPFPVNEITSLGLEFFAAAFAFGAAALRILAPAKALHDRAALAQQMGLAETVLGGLGYGEGRLALIETDDPDALAAALAALPKRAGARPRPFLPIGDTKRGLLRLAIAKLHEAALAPVDRLSLPKGAPFGALAVNVPGCTLCLACVSACPTGALVANPDAPQLRFTEDACVQCGLCKNTCPEKVIELVPRLDFTAAAKAPITIKEEAPAECLRCGKAFGTQSSVERVIAKLGGHWMAADEGMKRRLRLCADCRAIEQSESAFDPYAGAPRPFPRHTDENLARDDRPPEADKKKH